PALGDGDAGLVGADPSAVRIAADRHQHAVEGLFLGNAVALELAGDAVLLRPGRDDFRLEVHRYTLVLQTRREWAHEIRVRTGHQLVHELDHGDVAAERAVHSRHFQADDAAA